MEERDRKQRTRLKRLNGIGQGSEDLRSQGSVDGEVKGGETFGTHICESCCSISVSSFVDRCDRDN